MDRKTIEAGDFPVCLEVFTTNDAFAHLEAEWNPLLAQSLVNRIFLTWEWQSIWWQVYQPGQLHIITVRLADTNQLIGIAPLFLSQTERGTVAHLVGHVDVSDYLDVIVHQDYIDVVHTSLAEYFWTQRDLISSLDLQNIPAISPTHTLLAKGLQDQGFVVTTAPMEVCPVITLPESFEAHLAQMDKKQRHELRRKLRRAETATMDWYIVDDSHELTAETELFLQLMASANPDKAKFLQNPAHVAFFQRIVPMFYTLGWLQLAILRVEDVPAAAYLNFVYNHEVGVYNSGLNLEVGAAFSPGIVLLAYLIESAIQRGYRRFDFLRGDEEYKYRIGGRDEILYRMVAHATPTT